MRRLFATVLGTLLLVLILAGYAPAAGKIDRSMRDVSPGLSAADWADIQGQIGAGQPAVASPPDNSSLEVSSLGTSAAQQAYLKGSNTGGFDCFGYSVAVSGDTVVVGARYEASSATGVDGDQSNSSAFGAGAVYVFVRSGTTWTQQAYLKASNTGSSDGFGNSVAIAGDTVVVGAPSEDSSATGVNGDQSDNSATDSGAVYVFVRSGTTWTQQAYLKASNTHAFDGYGYPDSFGCSVAVSDDTLVVGAYGEDSSATGVNGNQTDNSAAQSGAAYVFARSGTTWTQQAYLKASTTDAHGWFGRSVGASGDTVVVGSPYEDGTSGNHGAAYVFVRRGTTWSQQARLKAPNAYGASDFGWSVAIWGDTAVAAATRANTAGALSPGAAYVFVRSGTTWSQQARLQASNMDQSDYFGDSLAISGDAVVVGAWAERSDATGVNGDQTDNSATASGAAYVFTRIGTAWFQEAYLKASNTDAYDHFGDSVAISGDTVVAGALYEASDATGIDGDQTDNSGYECGAAYVFAGLAEIPDAPTIAGLDPTGGPVTGGTSVTITGTDFYGVSGPGAVTFGGKNALAYAVDSDTQMTATTPYHVAGTVQVQITTSVGATADTAADDYTYEAAPAGPIPAHERVSLDSDEAQGNHESGVPSTSADGRYVAFESEGNNLVFGDTNVATDVFVRDRATGTTERVSVATNGTQGNGDSGNAAISADGRFVAFLSLAGNLVAGDVNGTWDVFVHDRQTGSTELVSVSSAEVQGNGTSAWTSISADGRYVCFASSSSNLVTGDSNALPDVFVRDRTNGTTERVSVSSSGAQANYDSDFAMISADGRYVVFDSLASNLVLGDTNGKWDAFVRDRTAGTTQRVSLTGSGTQGNNDSGYPRISADGRYVAFESYATNLVTGDSNGMADIFVRDRTAATTVRVSVSNGGVQGNDDSAFASISADGRYVAFESYAANLVTGDANAALDVFVRDRTEGTTRLVSVDASGVQGNDDSYWSSISGDGKYIAFGSAATTLVPGDTNGVEDVFAVATPTIPSYPSYRGSDRYDTAIKLSKAMFPGALSADSGLVLAPGETFPEALCGAPLAAAYSGPVLLTYKNTVLPNNVRAEMQRLAPKFVFCIGLSTTSVNAVISAMGPTVTVVPITGADPYVLSHNVAHELAAKVGTGGLMPAGTVGIITRGDNFPDAIGVSPLACAKLWPIILTNSGGTAMPAAATAAITELGLTQIIKVGTYATPPAGVAGLANLSGADRYFTNANVAEWSRDYAGLAFTHLGIATGDKFPDALAAGPYLAQQGGVLLLSPLLGPLPACIRAEIAAHAADVYNVTFIACIEPVIGQAKALLP